MRPHPLESSAPQKTPITVGLPPRFDKRTTEACQLLLLSLLHDPSSSDAVIRIETQSLCHIDTAGVQCLLAAGRSFRAHERRLCWCAHPVLEKAFTTLGCLSAYCDGLEGGA